MTGKRSMIPKLLKNALRVELPQTAQERAEKLAQDFLAWMETKPEILSGGFEFWEGLDDLNQLIEDARCEKKLSATTVQHWDRVTSHIYMLRNNIDLAIENIDTSARYCREFLELSGQERCPVDTAPKPESFLQKLRKIFRTKL